MRKNLVKNNDSVNLGGMFTFTSVLPKSGENINYATVNLVFGHKNYKNNS